MSRRISNNYKKAVVSSSAFCHVCEKAGEPRTWYESHNFRDNNGKVCCKRFLEKLRSHKCTCCGKMGNHFSNQCKEPNMQQLMTFNATIYKKTEKSKEVKKQTTSVPINVFTALEDLLDEDEPIHQNITVRTKAKFIMNWADCESSDDDA